jgi:nitric oxide reductase large subunit
MYPPGVVQKLGNFERWGVTTAWMVSGLYIFPMANPLEKLEMGNRFRLYIFFWVVPGKQIQCLGCGLAALSPFSQQTLTIDFGHHKAS